MCSIILLYRMIPTNANTICMPIIILPICKVQHSSQSPFGRDRSVGTAIRGDETVRTGLDLHLHHSPLAFELRLSSFNWQKEKTGEMPSLEAAASKLGSIRGWKSLGKPKGNAILWAKVVQITRFNEEIPGAEKCADIKSKFAAEMCHQGIGVSYSTCITTKIGMWFKYRRIRR